MKWKLLLLSSVLLAGAAQAQTPTPLGTIKREPFTAKPEPEAKPQIKPEPQMEWRRDTERQVKHWWQPLPAGWVACSLSPQGMQVCGNGYWVEMR